MLTLTLSSRESAEFRRCARGRRQGANLEATDLAVQPLLLQQIHSPVFDAELHSGVGPVGALGAGGAVAGGDAVAALGGGALGGFDGGGGGGAGASSARGAFGTGSRPLTPRARVVISVAHTAAVRTSGSAREPPPSAAAAEAHACFAR